MINPSSLDPSTEPIDEPLPQTLRFVFAIGTFILVGWFMMYFLMRARW